MLIFSVLSAKRSVFVKTEKPRALLKLPLLRFPVHHRMGILLHLPLWGFALAIAFYKPYNVQHRWFVFWQFLI
jgi:hypothetical protein